MERGGWFDQMVAGLALVGAFMFVWFGWTEWRPAADQLERWVGYQEVSVKLGRIEARGGKYPEWAGSGWINGGLVELTHHDLDEALGKADRVGAWEARVQAAKNASGRELRALWNPDALWRLAPADAHKDGVDARCQLARGAALSALGVSICGFMWLWWRRANSMGRKKSGGGRGGSKMKKSSARRS